MQFRCAALLFDLDGVLCDSRAVVERTCRRWALRHQLDPDEVLRIAHGRRTRDTVKAAAPHLETDREAAWIDAVELADIDGLSAVPGSPELLAALPPTSWAVVTSCGRALAELRLTSAGLPIPRIVVTSEDVAHGKPLNLQPRLDQLADSLCNPGSPAVRTRIRSGASSARKIPTAHWTRSARRFSRR